MDITKLIPINGRLLIKVIEEEVKYTGTIEIAGKTKEKTNFGVVMKTHDESKINVDDKIVFPLYAGTIFYTGTEFDSDREEYRVIKEEDVLGFIRD